MKKGTKVPQDLSSPALNAYLCHVIEDFLLVLKRSTKVSENSDLTKS